MEVRISSFTKWYGANKAAFNAKRRARLLADPDYRARQVSNTKAWRSRAKNLQPNDDGTFGIYAAALVLDRSVPAIRKWESQGLIPKQPYQVRKYTRKQMSLMQDLVNFLEIKPRPKDYPHARKIVVNTIWACWELP